MIVSPFIIFTLQRLMFQSQQFSFLSNENIDLPVEITVRESIESMHRPLPPAFSVKAIDRPNDDSRFFAIEKPSLERRGAAHSEKRLKKLNAKQVPGA